MMNGEWRKALFFNDLFDFSLIIYLIYILVVTKKAKRLVDVVTNCFAFSKAPLSIKRPKCAFFTILHFYKPSNKSLSIV